VAPNLLDQNFAANRPNQVWLADITYIATGEGWLYLAVILDLFTRKVVGWEMRDHMRAELTIAALTMAIQRRRPGRVVAKRRLTALDLCSRMITPSALATQQLGFAALRVPTPAHLRRQRRAAR